MCGIIGMAGRLEYKDKELFRDMFMVLPLRGEDSTGTFTVKAKEAGATVAKCVGTPFDFFQTKGWDQNSFFDKRAVIGHCRKATVGAVTKHTAHPYQVDHITGVHNGTLRNWRDLPGDKYATDSHTLFAHMAANGYRNTIEATDGAYALIWWDEQTETLNIIRNKERSLFYAFSEDGKKILFASESWMITVNAQRNGFKLMDLTPQEQTYCHTLPVPEDELFKLTITEDFKQPIRFLEDADGKPEIVKGGVNLPVKAVPFRPPYAQQTQNPPYRYRQPFDWETGDNPQQGLPSAGRVNNSSTPALSSPSASSASTPATTPISSRPSRPTLSLVQTSKSGGSASSNNLNDSLDDLTTTGAWGPCLNGNGDLLLNKDEFGVLVDPNCAWCQVGYSFEELKDEQALGFWISDDNFVCQGCVDNAADAGYNMHSCC